MSYIDELMSAALQAFGMWLVTSERVANFGHVHRCISIWQDLRFQRLLRSMVLPEMPVAPPESDYGDDSIEHPSSSDRTREGILLYLLVPPVDLCLRQDRWQDVYRVHEELAVLGDLHGPS